MVNNQKTFLIDEKNANFGAEDMFSIQFAIES